MVPEALSFREGKFYIQHHPEAVNGLIAAAWGLMHETRVGVGEPQHEETSSEHGGDSLSVDALWSMIRAYAREDQKSASLECFFTRLRCVDFEHCTEWGQPYFANGEGKGWRGHATCVNPGAALALWERRGLEDAILPVNIDHDHKSRRL